MGAYSALQEREFSEGAHSCAAVRHQRFVGTGYFDEVTQLVAHGMAFTAAFAGSTEEEQFAPAV